jgi:DNA polymerase/3'-5' exonuclease PolX
VQAEGLYNRGITNLDLLRAQVALDAAEGAPHRTLMAAQLIGLAHVDDFEKKIPRSEMETLFGLVRARALAILPGVKATAAGSFRRGAAFSGDLDVIFTHGDEDGGAEMVRELVRSLLADGVITAELKGGGRTDKGGVTWNGVIRLPAHLVPQGSERPPFRRLDLKFYPSQFYFYALLYFTGSDHFNRSMRYYADKWKRLSLSDWGLVVSGDKTYDGQEREKAAYTTSPPADCEEDIFRLLVRPHRFLTSFRAHSASRVQGLTYVPPEKRSV